MIINENKLSSRQKHLVRQIGRENRDKIDFEVKKMKLYCFLIIVLVITGDIILFMIDWIDVVNLVIIVLSPIAILGPISSLIKKIKDLRNLKQKSDYDIGMFYANKDKRVKGNADIEFKAKRTLALGFGIPIFLMAVIIFIISFFSEPVNFDELIKVEGILEEVSNFGGENNRIEIRLKNDNTKYVIDGLYIRKFGWNEFDDLPIKKGLSITMYCTDNDVKSWVYYVEINGVEYLTFEEVKIRQEENKQLGIIFGSVFTFIGIASFTYLLFYKNVLYKKYKENEIFNLEYNDEELNEIMEEYKEYSGGTSYIKTSYPKSFLYIFIGFSVISLGLIIGSLFAMSNLELFIILMVIGVIFGLISILGLFDLTKNYEVLVKDTLIVNRFFKKKVINVKDIKNVRYIGLYVCFYGHNDKILCRIDVNTVGVNDIVEELISRGVMVNVDLRM